MVTGYGPEVDPAAMGYAISAFVLLELNQGRLAEAAELLRRFPRSSRPTPSAARRTSCAASSPATPSTCRTSSTAARDAGDPALHEPHRPLAAGAAAHGPARRVRRGNQVKISAKTDYAVRAATELAAAADDGRPVKGEALATAQSIPLKFLEISRNFSGMDCALASDSPLTGRPSSAAAAELRAPRARRSRSWPRSSTPEAPAEATAGPCAAAPPARGRCGSCSAGSPASRAGC